MKSMTIVVLVLGCVLTACSVAPTEQRPTEQFQQAEVSAEASVTEEEIDPRIARAAADLAARKSVVFSSNICQPAILGGSVRNTPRIGLGDGADVTATSYAMYVKGGVEMNPLYSWAGNGAPFVAGALKFSMKKVFEQQGYSPKDTNQYIESFGAGIGCGNVVAVSGAFSPLLWAGATLTCGFIQNNRLKKQYERELDECGVTNVAETK